MGGILELDGFIQVDELGEVFEQCNVSRRKSKV